VTGRFHEADVQYEKALSLRPNHPQLNYFHGVVLEKLGKRKVKGKIILSLHMGRDFLSFLFFLSAPPGFSTEVQNGGNSVVFIIWRGKAYG